MKNAFVFWKCDKESHFALQRAVHAGLEPRLLLACIDDATGLGMGNDLPPELIEEQADLINLPLLMFRTTFASYYRDMQRLLFDLRSDGITRGVFGNVRRHDDQDQIELLLGDFDMRGVYPLRGVPPLHLVGRQLESLRSVIIRIDRDTISESYLGRDFDAEFVEYLMENGIDPTGEGGEFGTFVCRSPLMRREIILTHAERLATPGAISLEIDFWKVE